MRDYEPAEAFQPAAGYQASQPWPAASVGTTKA